MITVIVPNSENETLIKEICCILEKFGGACFVSQNSVQDFFAVSPSFLFFLTDTVCTVPSKNTVCADKTISAFPVRKAGTCTSPFKIPFTHCRARKYCPVNFPYSATQPHGTMLYCMLLHFCFWQKKRTRKP